MTQSPPIVSDRTHLFGSSTRMTHHLPSTFARNKDALLIEGGYVRVDFNPLTGDYLVTGQNGKGSCPYAVGSVHSGVDIPTARRRAICLALTVHHYVLTGETRTFSAPSYCPAVYGAHNTFTIPYSA